MQNMVSLYGGDHNVKTICLIIELLQETTNTGRFIMASDECLQTVGERLHKDFWS